MFKKQSKDLSVSLSAIMPYAFIAISACVLGFRLFGSNYLYGYDAPMHGLWAQQFLKGMYFGDLYPRWAGDLNAGSGSPSFVFNPPLVFYTYAVIGVFRDNVLEILSISAFLALILSGVAMYSLCKRLMGRMPASISAILYMALPYHLLDIYQKTTMTELWAFVWMPLIFLYIILSNRNGIAISIAGILLTHLQTALLASIYSSLLVIYLFISERDSKSLTNRLYGLALGILIASAYLIPSVFGQGNVNLHDAYSGIFDFRGNFIFTGFKYSKALLDTYTTISSAALLLVCSYPIISLFAKRPAKHGMLLFLSICGASAFFMMLKQSMIVWDSLGFAGLYKLQFPTRFLSPMTLFASISIGAVFDLRPKGKLKKASLYLAICVLVMINLALSLFIVKNAPAISKSTGLTLTKNMSYDETVKTYAALDNAWRVNAPASVLTEGLALSANLADVPNFMPKWSKLNSHKLNDMVKNNRVASVNADIALWQPQKKIIRLYSNGKSDILMRTFYYPGWSAQIDGTDAEIRPDTETGLISIRPPSGRHVIKIEFGMDRQMKTGAAFSLVGIALFLMPTFIRMTKNALK